MQAPASSLSPGDVVGQRYVVQGPIGSGSMGEIFLALQRPFDRPIALKVLQPWLDKNDDMERRFLLEAQVLSRLSHPNTVTVYEFGRHRESCYIAMEYVRGQSLADLVRREGPLDPEDAVPLAVQVAQSLAEAHSLGVIHRDLKPENILVSQQRSSSAPFVKVVDFGIAKLAREDARSSAVMVGTPHFMAPEQAKGGRIDGRADLYALGCVLFEMLTGAPPFAGELSMEVVVQHMEAARPTLPVHLPRPLDAFVKRAMAIDPDDRPDDAMTFVAELVVAATAAAGQSLNGHGRSHSSVQLTALGVASGATPVPPPLPEAPAIGDDHRPTLIGEQDRRITEEDSRPLGSSLDAVPAVLATDPSATKPEAISAEPTLAVQPPSDATADRPSGGASDRSRLLVWALAGVVVAAALAAIVLALVNASSGEPAAVTIDSAPAGAVVEIDGRAVGVTPLELTLGDVEQLAGTLRLDGYESMSFERSVGGGDTVFLALDRAVVDLEIVAPEAVHNATLIVNGEPYGAVGEARRVRLEWPSDRLRIQLDAPEYHPLVESIPASALQSSLRVEFDDKRLVRR